MPDVMVDGEVVEADPPRKARRTWHPLWDEEIAGRDHPLTYDIEEDDGRASRGLTVTHEARGCAE